MMPFACLKVLTLVVLCLCLPGSLAWCAQPERQVEVEIRTIGWGVQAANLYAGSERTPLHVLNTQIAGPFIYRGPPTLTIYRGNRIASSADPLDDEPDMHLPSLAEEGSLLPAPANPVVPLLPVATVSGLKNRQKVLLFFLPGNGGKLGQIYKVLVFDDAASNNSRSGIRFYNLCERQLAVKILDKVQAVAPGGSGQWGAAQDGAQGVVAVAVTNPEAKLVYASRFRMGQGQRMIFFAMPAQGKEADGVRVVSLLESVDAVRYDDDL